MLPEVAAQTIHPQIGQCRLGVFVKKEYINLHILLTLL